MTGKLDIRIFAHSWVSDWNQGNAHFLRGLARNLKRMGHGVRCYEQLGSWSLSNLVKHEGERAIDSIDQFRRAYPELDIRFYNQEGFEEFAARELRGADVVLIHEWNEPAVVNTILGLKKQLGFKALFHDTHHRAYTSPREILQLHLNLFDGVLAFGEPLRKIYTDGFGVPKAWTFHEAADVDSFGPRQTHKTFDVLWIGNWGDEERSEELREYFIQPVGSVSKDRAVAHGVRYPVEAVKELAEAGIEYRGYLPNLRAPEVYAASRVSMHIPRRQYANGLSGIPTIRVFEALACGATLLCSPWSDVESLFRAGEDFLVVQSGREMQGELERLLHDDDARAQIAANGLKTVRERHTCAHRAAQLIGICEELEK